jgi:hypothetical protein
MNARCTIQFENGPTHKRDFVQYTSELRLQQDIDHWETTVVQHYPDWEYELTIDKEDE